MEKHDENSKLAARFLTQMQCLQNLIDQVSQLETRITKMASKLGTYSMNNDTVQCKRSTFNTISSCPTNIIQFPGIAGQKTNRLPILAPILAKPGAPLSPGIFDFRPVLQRDGLILLAWDKRFTESGELYSAYWVTSSGIPRFYASKPLPEQDFSFARPNHKSYAAEDGIEFYGQDAPAYIVHVAPELMMSNPRHSELRLTHISTLKLQGSEVDFDYKYLLKTEKNRNMSTRKSRNSSPRHQAWA